MSAREVPAKKYVVCLNAEEREQLDALIRKSQKSRRGSATATATTPKPIGTSQPKRPASNSSTCTLHF